MQNYLTILALATAVILSGCSVNNQKAQTANTKNSDSICTYEKVTGSNMKKKICRTQAEIDTQEKVAQKAIQNKTRQSL